ncbi:MAG: hypothetical protein NTW08_00200 [Gammaproteobacteria bacterium]|nr:hypothetical protein [Gammaproteobacteria bacterium]
MKKLLMTGLLGLSSLTLHAGAMGPVSTAMGSTPYLAGEGTYTWNTVNGFTINGSAPSVSKNGWGGRLSVGLDRPYTEKFSLNAEVGGGFYGSTSLKNPAAGVNASVNITGYDILAGGTYHMQYIDVFGDFGFMAQSLLSTMERDNGLRFPGGVFAGATRGHSTQTQILPELKVGTAYNFCENLSLTFSYMYAFGSTISGNIVSTAVDLPPTTINDSGVINIRNPSLSTLLLGLRYHFA